MGLGYWPGAIAVTVVTVVALYALRWVEEGGWLRRLSPNQFEYVIEASPTLTVASLAEVVEGNRSRIEAIHLERPDGGARRLRLLVRLPFGADAASFADTLATTDGVSAVDWKS